MSKTLPPEIEKQARECFKKYDKDGNGTIDREELTKLMTDTAEEIGIPKPSDDDISTVLKETDANNDQKIQWDEFLELFKIIYFMKTMFE